MSTYNLAQELVPLLARTLPDTLKVSPAWAALQQRLTGDRTAQATLTLFESDPGSADLQHRLIEALATRCTAGELQTMIDDLRGAAPQVRSRLTADEDALIQGSGHKVLAPDGSVDLATSAGKRGRIIDSPITIVGGGAAQAWPAPANTTTAPASRRGPLTQTLSTDGVHFTYGHALLIGVGRYQHQRLSVHGDTTTADARALAALLCDPQRAAYPEEHVRLLLDANATRMGILDALEALAQRLTSAPGGTALIFFAGHGEPCGDSYALLPHDADMANLGETAVTAELFHDAVDRVRAHARRLVVLLNCCHAGGVGDGVLGEDEVLSGEAPPPEFYRPLAAGSGQVVISSSRPRQKSGARSGYNRAHTTFGAQLLAALAGGAAGQGPGIGVFELFSHLRLHVPPDAATITYRGAPLVQEPLFYASQLDDNIAVALRPSGIGGVLGAEAGLVVRLVELELQIESGHATPALLAERDALLAQMARAEI